MTAKSGLTRPALAREERESVAYLSRYNPWTSRERESIVLRKKVSSTSPRYFVVPGEDAFIGNSQWSRRLRVSFCDDDISTTFQMSVILELKA